MLESLVQDEPLRARYVMVPATLAKKLKIERVTPDQLPTDWRDLGKQMGSWSHLRSASDIRQSA